MTPSTFSISSAGSQKQPIPKEASLTAFSSVDDDRVTGARRQLLLLSRGTNPSMAVGVSSKTTDSTALSLEVMIVRFIAFLCCQLVLWASECSRSLRRGKKLNEKEDWNDEDFFFFLHTLLTLNSASVDDARRYFRAQMAVCRTTS
jgi:hypothetical protein